MSILRTIGLTSQVAEFLAWTTSDAEGASTLFAKDREVFMSRSRRSFSKAVSGDTVPMRFGTLTQTRKMNHLKDEVYREMLLLEVDHPGSEMGLALALLRAFVQSDSLAAEGDFGGWLRAVYPIGLQMIEKSLGRRSKCSLQVI